MREIGGYFGLEEFWGREYYPELIALNTGRGALEYLIKAKRIERLHLPYFLCDVVAETCKKSGAKAELYHVTETLMPPLNKPLGKGEYLYVVNYYGLIANETVLSLKAKYGNIILDNTHAFFQRPAVGVDTIYSCRKFFGVPDGAYLSTDVQLEAGLKTDISARRMAHILGRCEDRASDHYASFKAADDALGGVNVMHMSKLTHNLLGAIDYERVRERRNANYAVLKEVLGGMNKLCWAKPDGPFCYPFYHSGGMALKRRLAQQGIYVPTLWPNVLAAGSALEREYAANILPLPCDQRYGKEDMLTVTEAVLDSFKNLI